MDNRTLYRWVEEIRQQCRFARLAARNMKNELRAMDSEAAFFYVHALLHFARNLDRMLWPPAEESRARGESLRQELKAPETLNSLLREIQPQLESEEERFGDWLAGLGESGYVNMNIMPQGSISDFQQDIFQRNLDPETLRLEFRGLSCDLKKLLEAIQRLDDSTQAWLRHHHPW